MTRKHFEIIAAALRSTRPPVELMPTDGPAAYSQWRDDVTSMTVALVDTNPRFDQAKFLKACGVED
jgi:hypothetical protein